MNADWHLSTMFGEKSPFHPKSPLFPLWTEFQLLTGEW